MTIHELNNLLSTFAEQKRENILGFSFALLEWMGITPNTDVPGHVGVIKPRLITPQTQKLKEFLAPAPLTVQPQLYRLSAEGQPIRVRFAVLKKLKKDTISQLVDNDPGLTSYQASSKGIINVPGRPPYIPQQPYFIHFVTTPAYDKLTLIFNQNDQKRLVTFRNCLTKTQYHKILEKWQGIGTKPKPEIADVLWKSLDIKDVNKEFYKQIKERFDALVGVAKAHGSVLNEEAVKQFAVRLIGRYIFCWFLKEKGVIPEKLLSSDTIQDYRDTFSQLFLKKLFFKTLNAEVTDPGRTETITPLDDLYRNIPYLNGGLFDFHAEDVLFDQLDLNNWLVTFVKVLEEFDFTVDESNSQYQMVAIDPEMLGRIFENLLASQNPDTEKMANQRKAFGAFYTPREIVDYMVNESLKAHLETQLMPAPAQDASLLNEPMVEYKGTLLQHLEPQQTLLNFQDKQNSADNERRNEKIKANLAKLFSPDCSENPFDKDDTLLVRKALSEITVLDPACGSGAFPMGMMLRLMELRQVVGHGHRNSYDLKEEILSRNIFGVDIMPMAVEIARLRAWLSLVLEADYKPADRKNNFGIAALPNLDFKFICANSLIDSGYDAFLEKTNIQKVHFKEFFELKELIQNLEELRNSYFDPKGDSSKKAEIKRKFNTTKQAIKNWYSKLGNVKRDYLGNFFDKITDWNPFDDSHPSSFFSPAWMFGIRNGFDVVIGNPPYVYRNAENEELKKYFAANFKSAEGNFDLYKFFLEKTVLILKDNANSCLIVPNTFLTAKSFYKLRKFILDNSVVLEIFDLGENLFEGVTVENVIIRLRKNLEKNFNSKIKIQRNRENSFDILDASYELNLNEIFNRENSFNIYLNSSTDFLINKARVNTIELGRIAYCTVGINTGYIKKELTATNKIDSTYHKMLSGRDIGVNTVEWKKHWIKYDKSFVNSFGDRGRSLPPEYIFTNEKILVQRTRRGLKRKLVCYYDTEKYYNLNRLSNIVLNDDTYSLKYIHALLNSSLMDYYFNILFNEYEVKPVHLAKLPIKKASDNQQKKFISIVDQIIQNKKARLDTTALEKEIDVLVYKLYELTYDEVKIVDKDFWMSEEEYGKIKI